MRHRHAERRHLERKVGAAHAGAVDRTDAHDARTFAHRTRADAARLGLLAPRLALGHEAAAAARGQRAEPDNNDEAAETFPQPARHVGTMRRSLLTSLQSIMAGTEALVRRSRYG